MRILRGLNQDELASRCKITQAGISRMENVDNLTVATLRRIAKVLDASLVVQLVPNENASECLSPTDQLCTEQSLRGNGGIKMHEREIRRCAKLIAAALSQASNATEPSH